jgi:hypothetical protein
MAKKKSIQKNEEVGLVDEAQVGLSEDAGVAEQVKEPDIELVDELIRYEFSDVELVDMATDIGELMQQMDRLTLEKKSAASSFDADIKKADLDMQEIAKNIRDRFEMRREPCYVVKDYKGRKAYYFRADQRELEWLKTWAMVRGVEFTEKILQLENDDFADGPVKTRDLKSWELQMELEFDQQEDADFKNPEDTNADAANVKGPVKSGPEGE